MSDPVTVFVTGGTGYIGGQLLPRLIAQGHRVYALARPAARAKLPFGAQVVLGDALDARSYQTQVPRGCTFVHLVGVSHPNPGKAAQFFSVDLASVRASLDAALNAGARHFVYISVAQPAPVMQAYIATRQAAETLIRTSGIPATILRPWYVLGPGHRWPILLRPVYWLAECFPPTARTAHRLGLVKLDRFVDALIRAIESPATQDCRVLDVSSIRSLAF
ncbi:MAG: NAD(P)H-binding protein [Pseudomonadota bacterium]